MIEFVTLGSMNYKNIKGGFCQYMARKILFIIFALFVAVPSFADSTAWWNNHYQYRRNVSINGTSGTLGTITLDTISPINSGKMRPDRKDLRLVYNGSEIDYQLSDTSTLKFKIQATGVDSKYYVYYGYSAASTLPKENLRNVLNFYANGDDLASFTGSGMTTTSVPMVDFKKTAANPVITRATGSTSESVVRNLTGLFYENGWWYTIYAGGDLGVYSTYPSWVVHMRKSQDRVNWIEVGIVIQPQGGNVWTDPSGLYKVGSKYVILAATGVNYDEPTGTDLPPYTNVSMWDADNIEGPYTYRAQKLSSYTFPGGFVEENNNCSQLFTEDGGSTYTVIKSTEHFSTAPWQGGMTYATLSDPYGTWTQSGTLLIPRTEQIESPLVVKDTINSRYYAFATIVGSGPSGAVYTMGNVAYWSNSLLSGWNVSNKVTIFGPDYGAWDGGVIGSVGIPVIKDGMIYFTYDGKNTITNDTGIHIDRDGGMVEARWPFTFGNAMKTTAGSGVTSSTSFSNSIIKIKAKINGTSAAKIGIGSPGGTHVYFTLASSGTAVNLDINGTPQSAGFDWGRIHGKVFEIRIDGTGTKMIFDGVQVYSTATQYQNLPIYIDADSVVESIQVIPATSTVASIDTEVVFGPVSNLGNTGKISTVGLKGKITVR